MRKEGLYSTRLTQLESSFKQLRAIENQRRLKAGKQLDSDYDSEGIRWLGRPLTNAHPVVNNALT